MAYDAHKKLFNLKALIHRYLYISDNNILILVYNHLQMNSLLSIDIK